MNTSAAETLYAQVDIESQVLNASPYQLEILFDGALSALKRAVIYIEQNNIQQKSRAISKAVGQVTALGAIAGLPEPLQQKLTNMLQTILRDESEIRQLMHSRTNQLATFIRETAQ
ncbi:MAG: flagellar protein FliS [Candidatus Arsenophonus phytopathogenicus]